MGKNTKMQRAHAFLLWFNPTRGYESASCTKLREFNIYSFRLHSLIHQTSKKYKTDRQQYELKSNWRQTEATQQAEKTRTNSNS